MVVEHGTYGVEAVKNRYPASTRGRIAIRPYDGRCRGAW